MDITNLYLAYMSAISPVIAAAGMIALTVTVIVTLINMLIDAFVGKGLRIGAR